MASSQWLGRSFQRCEFIRRHVHGLEHRDRGLDVEAANSTINWY
jgi:hypothetical protein